LARTHPFVAGLATHVLDAALDPLLGGPATRCGAMRTSAVKERTVMILLRHRFHLATTRAGEESMLLAEDCAVLGFAGPPASPQWLAADVVAELLDVEPEGNVTPEAARDFVAEVLAAAPAWAETLAGDARERAAALLTAHERVRTAARQRGVRHRVAPQLPPDILGAYILLPVLRRPA
jgi:hypothetical protein